jgi:hypothetical protein
MPFYLILKGCKLNLKNQDYPDSETGIGTKNNINSWVSNRFMSGTVFTVPFY